MANTEKHKAIFKENIKKRKESLPEREQELVREVGGGDVKKVRGEEIQGSAEIK